MSRIRLSKIKNVQVRSGRCRVLGEQEEGNMKKSRKAAYRDLCEAREIVKEIRAGRTAASKPRVKIDKMPGLSPMQIRKQIDQIVDLRTEMEKIRRDYEKVLAQLTSLEGEEKKGLAELKKAAVQMKEKDRYLIEATKGLLEFTAYMSTKRPGIEQMIGDPKESKLGDKAGEFFLRVGKELGDQVQKAVQQIYVQTKEDLSHTVDAVKLLKVVPKTAGVTPATLRKAGVKDVVDAAKAWLSGKASKFMSIAKNLKAWVDGFVRRTKNVRDAKNDILKAVKKAETAIGKYA